MAEANWSIDDCAESYRWFRVQMRGKNADTHAKASGSEDDEERMTAPSSAPVVEEEEEVFDLEEESEDDDDDHYLCCAGIELYGDLDTTQ